MTIHSLTAQEFWIAIIPICVVGLIYFGGEAIRDEFKISNEKPWRWGDPQRRGSDGATWGTHFVIAPVCLFIAGLTVRLLLRW